MPLSLYDLSVPTFLQTVRAIGGVLDRASAHFAAKSVDADAFVHTRLAPDMAPFYFQIEALKNHSVWGLNAVRTGVFTVPPLAGAVPFADLRAMVSEAVGALEALSPEEVNGWGGKTMEIDIHRPVDAANPTTSRWAPRTFTLTPEVFLLTYSLPNFYFHAVTAYNILRAHGVPIGKADFEGRLRGH
jgi:hypothetical protein